MSPRIVVTPFLKAVLIADALIGVASALLMSLAAGPLSGWLGLPETLLFGGGIALLFYAAVVGWAAFAPSLPRALLPATIATNLLWAVACIEVLLTFRGGLTLLGHAFVGVHIATVLVFAHLQWLGMRRGRAMTAAG